jgi:DNA-binding NarL/FixJ family response regulator
VPAGPVKVLVLYSHPLMGEGLGQMLAAEPGIVVYAVDIAEQTAVDEALASEPAVIVVEEGGRVDAADVVRRSSCPVVLDVDITTTRAWALHRESLNSRPDEFLAAIRAAVNGAAQPAGTGAGDGRDTAATDRPGRTTSDKPLAPVITPG